MVHQKITLPWRKWYNHYNTNKVQVSHGHRTLNGIQHGVDPGIPYDADPRSVGKNFVATDKHVDVFRDIVDGLCTGYLEGPFDPDSEIGKSIILSPLQSVPRPDGGKERIIHNLSKNKHLGVSVNSFINENDKKVVYNNIRHIVELFQFIGPTGYANVWDMFEAYRQVKIHPNFRNYLGFQWYNKLYRYSALPFGLASAPKLYSEFAEILRCLTIIANRDIWLLDDVELLYNYLDDFWSAHRDIDIVWRQFVAFLWNLVDLGIPTQWKKVRPPNQVQKILGFIFDIRNQCFYVPWDKVVRICKQIDLLIVNKNRTKKDIASVKGKLAWTSQVIKPSKAFLRELDYLIARPVPWDRKGIRLSKQAILDLRFWQAILQSQHNALSFEFFLRDPRIGDIHVWTDAAIRNGTGMGGFASTGEFFQTPWSMLPENWPWPRNDSSGPELLAVVAFGTILALKYNNSSIVFHCDNEAVIPIITREVCSLRKKAHMALVRYFITTMFEQRIKFWVSHIPGEYNIEADNLSRFKHEPLQRLYQHPPPDDEWIKPFFNINPQFPLNFSFNKLNITNHIKDCLNLAISQQ